MNKTIFISVCAIISQFSLFQSSNFESTKDNIKSLNVSEYNGTQDPSFSDSQLNSSCNSDEIGDWNHIVDDSRGFSIYWKKGYRDASLQVKMINNHPNEKRTFYTEVSYYLNAEKISKSSTFYSVKPSGESKNTIASSMRDNAFSEVSNVAVEIKEIKTSKY